MMLETPRRSGDFNNCRRIATSAGSRQAHRTSRPGPDRPLFLERPSRSGCGRRAEVETAFKAGTVDTGPASALQGTDLASSILHQLRQHLTAPVSARARGVSRSVSAWGPPPARPIYRTGGSLGPPSLEARRVRRTYPNRCRSPCGRTWRSRSCRVPHARDGLRRLLGSLSESPQGGCMSTKAITIEGRVVLVTGANRGIGQALVEEALRRGAKRLYAGTRQPLAHRDPRVTPLTLDVTNAAQIQAAVEKVESLDILINNAGLALA